MSIEQNRKSANSVTVQGRIIETNMKFDKDVTDNFDDNNKGGIVKKEFKNPLMTIAVKRTDGTVATVSVEAFSIMQNRKDKDGKYVENSTFTAMKSIMDLGTDAKDMPIRITGTYGENMYLNKDDVLVSIPQINMSYVETNEAKMKHNTDGTLMEFADGQISGVIKSISDELIGGEETGNKLLSVWFVSGVQSKRLNLLDRIVIDSDLFEEFEFDEGDSVKLDIEVKDVQRGTVQEETTSRRRKADNVGGYVAHEFHVFNWDDNFDEDSTDRRGNKIYISEDDVKELQHERDIRIEAKKKKSEEKNEPSHKSIGSRRNTNNDNLGEGGIGDDNPFDEDDPFA